MVPLEGKKNETTCIDFGRSSLIYVVATQKLSDKRQQGLFFSYSKTASCRVRSWAWLLHGFLCIMSSSKKITAWVCVGNDISGHENAKSNWVVIVKSNLYDHHQTWMNTLFAVKRENLEAIKFWGFKHVLRWSFQNAPNAAHAPGNAGETSHRNESDFGIKPFPIRSMYDIFTYIDPINLSHSCR